MSTSNGIKGVPTLLVVEDQSSIRDLLSLQLTASGYTVLLAADACEGLERILDHPEIALVVSDVVMPGLTGPEMVAEARRHRPDLPVVFMSGYPGGAESCAAAGAGGDVLLDKPFTMRELTRAVEAGLEKP